MTATTDNNPAGKGQAMATDNTSTGEHVVKGLRLREAARFQRARPAASAHYAPPGARSDRREADEADRMADALLTLPVAPAIGAGGELHLSHDDAAAKPGLACTVENPDMVTVEASRERLELTADARYLSLAAGLADTLQARRQVKKALAHQMAAAHQMAMRFAATANKWLDKAHPDSPFKGAKSASAAMVEAQRAANASARLMSAYQDAALALQRLRTGGRQVVTVQHVQVAGGGQAVVAGKVTMDHRVRRRGRGQGQGRKSK